MQSYVSAGGTRSITLPAPMLKPIVYHIPVCPFSQRLEILLALKRQRDAVDFRVVDVTVPRPEWLLEKTGGSTQLPVLETEGGDVLRESLVLLRYLDARLEPRIAASEPRLHALEEMMAGFERELVSTGYGYVMNRELERRADLERRLLAQFAAMDAFLRRYARGERFLMAQFGWAEAVLTPVFMRLWFVEYYEGFELPADGRFERVRAYRDACLAHPAAQQVTFEQVVKLYYDYARGAGNGGLLPGRSRSSFVLEPHWSERPWPPRDKYGPAATDAELGLAPKS